MVFAVVIAGAGSCTRRPHSRRIVKWPRCVPTAASSLAIHANGSKFEPGGDAGVILRNAKEVDETADGQPTS